MGTKSSGYPSPKSENHQPSSDSNERYVYTHEHYLESSSSGRPRGLGLPRDWGERPKQKDAGRGGRGHRRCGELLPRGRPPRPLREAPRPPRFAGLQLDSRRIAGEHRQRRTPGFVGEERGRRRHGGSHARRGSRCSRRRTQHPNPQPRPRRQSLRGRLINLTASGCLLYNFPTPFLFFVMQRLNFSQKKKKKKKKKKK